MTRAEAVAIVQRLTAAWPRGPWPEETVELYVAELERLLDAALAAEVVAGMVRGPGQFAPTVGEIVTAYQERRLWRAERAARGRQLPEAPDRGPIPPEVVAELERLLGRPLRLRDMDDAA